MSSIAKAEEKKEKENKTNTAAPVQQTVQRDLSDVNGPEGGMLPNDVSAKIQSMRGSGQKLSEKQNQYFSQKFGRDMSDVHVHTDAASDTISRSLNARAFTIGSDVFLTKGVNPDGGGASMQTMTHELTHVVQQGGHASSGPLKLGAADTAQEHEAESTAQREFDPKLKEEDAVQREIDPDLEEDAVQRESDTKLKENKTIQREAAVKPEESDTVQREVEPAYAVHDTIQRGFWSDLGSALGGAALNAIGLGESMGDFMSGDNKVKAAIAKMSSSTRTTYNTLEQNIKQGESEVADLDKRIKKNKKRIDAIGDDQTKAQEKALLTGGLAQIQPDYDQKKADLDNNLKQQLSMLQSVDATITTDDVNRYRSGKVKTFFSSVFSAIGGKVLGAFESDPEKKAEAQARGRNSINNWFASKNKTSAKDETEEQKATKAKELAQKQKSVEDSIWNDVQNDGMLSQHYTRLLFKREIAANHAKMIQESLQEGESQEDIKKSVLMLLKNKAGSAAANQGAQQPQQQSV